MERPNPIQVPGVTASFILVFLALTSILLSARYYLGLKEFHQTSTVIGRFQYEAPLIATQIYHETLGKIMSKNAPPALSAKSLNHLLNLNASPKDVIGVLSEEGSREVLSGNNVGGETLARLDFLSTVKVEYSFVDSDPHPDGTLHPILSVLLKMDANFCIKEPELCSHRSRIALPERMVY